MLPFYPVLFATLVSSVGRLRRHVLPLDLGLGTARAADDDLLIVRPALRLNGFPLDVLAASGAHRAHQPSIDAGTFSNYDEKVIGQTTLYGLPMLAVNMPITKTTLPGAALSVAPFALASASAGEPLSLTLNYSAVNKSTGVYYVVTNQPGADVQVAGARPIEPRLSLNLQQDNTVVHGVLMVGGTFADIADVDPVVSRVITDEVYADLAVEPLYDENQWYPAQLATVNRFWVRGAQSQGRLVVIPAQFKPTSNVASTMGTQRLYSNLQFEIYRAPITATDYIAPSIWQVQAMSSTAFLSFRVQADDDSGSLACVVVLYQQQGDTRWSKAELTLDPVTGWAQATVPPATRPIYYIAQVVDPTGNVALALDHGNPFEGLVEPPHVYLPLVLR
jgi:hypothetical protein